MQGFLAKADAEILETVDAKKARLGAEDALRLARDAHEVWVARGKKLTHFNMRKAPPADDELLAALLGPTGNLRAPVIRRGKRLFVGFNAEQFADFLS